MSLHNETLSTLWQRFYNHNVTRFIVGFIVLGIVSFIVLFGVQLEKNFNSSQVKPSDNDRAVNSASVSAFNTSYFQFQTDKHWRFIANESTQDTFVYRRINNGLVEADLTVHVNSQPTELQATRVLPVSQNEGSFNLTPTVVSDHCRDSLQDGQIENAGNVELELNSVTILCDVDGNGYTIVTGLENGTTAMDLLRPDSTNAQYMIYFNDLRFTAEPDEFENIIRTFQVR